MLVKQVYKNNVRNIPAASGRVIKMDYPKSKISLLCFLNAASNGEYIPKGFKWLT